MYKALYISPMIPSYNIRETVAFFTDLFDFAIFMITDGYAVLNKDNLTVHILNAGIDIGEMEFYISVDDIVGLWDTIRDKMTGIKFKPPFDREYGMREFHIVIPQTKTLLFVGQAIT